MIKKVQDYPPDSHELYFFDANAWIAALQNINQHVEPRLTPYVHFFEAIITLHRHKDTPQAKRVKHFPKIVMTSLLLSEIINTYMRNVAMVSYQRSNNLDDLKYKSGYRKTDHHEEQLRELCYNLTQFQDFLEPLDDNFVQVDPFSVLAAVNSSTDFNDLYSLYFLREIKGKIIPIVTDDHDFCQQGQLILTANPRLLSMASR